MENINNEEKQTPLMATITFNKNVKELTGKMDIMHFVDRIIFESETPPSMDEEFKSSFYIIVTINYDNGIVILVPKDSLELYKKEYFIYARIIKPLSE